MTSLRKTLGTIALTGAMLVGSAAPAAAYMPNPQPIVTKGVDARPPVVHFPFLRTFFPVDLAKRPVRGKKVVGRFFMGHDAYGRRVCWVVYSDGTEVLVLDAC